MPLDIDQVLAAARAILAEQDPAQPGPGLYVAEIDGVAIAVMNEESLDHAERWFEGGAFKDDLTVLLDQNGKSLWDGKSPILVRLATADEIGVWKRALSDAFTRGEIDDPEDSWLVFLVPVVDPTDEEEEVGMTV